MACGRRRASLKRLQRFDARTEVPAMSAILMILGFIVVIGALNIFEFGRLD
jgi:hypothetical protein